MDLVTILGLHGTSTNDTDDEIDYEDMDWEEPVYAHEPTNVDTSSPIVGQQAADDGDTQKMSRAEHIGIEPLCFRREQC